MVTCDGGAAFACSGMGCGYDWTQEDDGLIGAKHIEEKPLKARPSKKLRKGSKRRKKRKDSDASTAGVLPPDGDAGPSAPTKTFHGLPRRTATASSTRTSSSR